MNTSLVEVRHVGKIYESADSRPALGDLSLSIVQGTSTAIMGPSGSGKSTLLNLIAGLDRATSGTIVVHGQDITRLGETALARYRRSRIGLVFQFFNLLNNLTVLENVLIPAQLAGLSTREARARAMALLGRLGIGGQANAYPARISGGQRQRVAIARALVNNPILLLADEPTGALDTQSGEHVIDLLRDLNASGQTLILVTHDARLAGQCAQRIVTLEDGMIAHDTASARLEAV